MVNIFYIPSRFIIWLIGWNYITPDVLYKLSNKESLVIVFSHTSYYDFFILLLYMLAYPTELSHFKVLIAPKYFNKFKPILERFGAISSTPLENKNGGSIERIVNILDNCRPFAFLISPKGSIKKLEWRTGYYHIAQKLKVDFRVVGVDYETKSVCASNKISYLNDEPTIKSQLYNELRNIVPLYPEAEVVEIRKYNPEKVSVINIKSFINKIIFGCGCGCLIVFLIVFFE